MVTREPVAVSTAVALVLTAVILNVPFLAPVAWLHEPLIALVYALAAWWARRQVTPVSPEDGG
jgi:hypothetical protein